MVPHSPSGSKIGMELDTLTEREKWLLLARMIPLMENNFNLCELGPRSINKSHPRPTAFWSPVTRRPWATCGRKTVGLVGLWNCVSFDDVAVINFKDKDGIQIMRNYIASVSFAPSH